MEYLKYFTLLVVVSILSTTEATFSNDELNKTNSKSTGTLTEVVNTALDQIQQLLLSFGKHFRTKPVHDSSRKQLVQRDAVLNTNHLGNTTARTIIAQTTDCYFEDYEKQYYIFQILNLLTQMQEYEEFMDSNKSGVVFMHLEIPKPKCNGLSTTSTFSIDPSLTPVTPSTLTPNTMSSQKMSPTTEGYRRSNWDKEMLNQMQHMTVRQLDELFHKVKGEAQKGTIHVSISSICCSL